MRGTNSAEYQVTNKVFSSLFKAFPWHTASDSTGRMCAVIQLDQNVDQNVKMSHEDRKDLAIDLLTAQPCATVNMAGKKAQWFLTYGAIM